MKIPKKASAAIVVGREWANLAGVRIFLRRFQTPSNEIGGSDSSHLILAKVLDSEDDRGLWIELFTNQQQKDPKIEKLSLMIPLELHHYHCPYRRVDASDEERNEQNRLHRLTVFLAATGGENPCA